MPAIENIISFSKVLKVSAHKDDITVLTTDYLDTININNFVFAYSCDNTTGQLRSESLFLRSNPYLMNIFNTDNFFKLIYKNNTEIPHVLCASCKQQREILDILFDKNNRKFKSCLTFCYQGEGLQSGFLAIPQEVYFNNSRLDSTSLKYLLYFLGYALFNRYNKFRKELLFDSFTQRERDCLFWVSEGKTTWEIAKILYLSERTIRFHLDKVKRKLNTTTRAAAVAKAIKSDLI